MRADLEPSLVVDNSILMVWAFEDEDDPYAMEVLEAMEVRMALVPPLLIWEVTNVLAWAARNARITDETARSFLAQLERMPIRVTQPRGLSETAPIFEAARRFGLTAYDAEYLSLARDSGLPLATLDREILQAMKVAGVDRFSP